MKYLLPIFFLLLVSCSSPTVIRDTNGRRPKATESMPISGVKKKVSVLTFFNESPFDSLDLEINASEELIKEIGTTGIFNISSVSDGNLGSSKEIYAGGGMNLTPVAKLAKNKGIHFIVFGRILDARVREKSDDVGLVRETKTFAEAKVEVRIFDVNLNKEIFMETFMGQSDDSSFRLFVSEREDHLQFRRDLLRYAVRIAVRKVTPKLVDVASKLDWVGRVVKIIGPKIYLNTGRESGLNVGDILKVITEGHEIYDKETGAMIGMSQGEQKGTIEVVDFFGRDGAIAILHSGGSVQEGDSAILY